MDLLNNFQDSLSKINKLLRSPFALAEADAPHPEPPGGGLGSREAFLRETKGNTLYTFSSMAPTGGLSFSWTTPSIFVFTEILLFLLELA